MTAKLQTFFREYSEFHRHPTNLLTHKIAIPLIVFHVVAMLDWIPLYGGITAAHVGFILLIGWYLTLDIPFALIMAVFLFFCGIVGRLTPWWAVLSVATVGWGIQLAGHAVWEKRRPALVDNVLQTFIGPLFVLAIVSGRWKNRS